MGKKVKWIISGIIVVTLFVIFGVLIQARNSSNQKTVIKTVKTNSQTSKSGKATDTSNTSQVNYSNTEWMLMGYMAYARNNYKESDNISNTAELVDAVQEDLADGSLTANNTSKNLYILTNKYGSVDAKVAADQISVNANGNTITNTKSQLNTTFSNYQSQIKKMTSYVKKTDQTQASSNNIQLSDEEYVVAAFLARMNNSSTSENIKQVLNTLSKGVNTQIDDYLSLGKDEGKYYIATNVSTSQSIRYDITANSITGQEYATGQKLAAKTYSKEKLAEEFAAHKSELDQIIEKMSYNKEHAQDFYKAHENDN